MQNKKIILNFILFIIISSYLIQNSGAIPITTHNPVGTVANGNGYFTNEFTKFNITENRNIYVITNRTYAQLIEPIGYPTGQSNSYVLITAGTGQVLRYGLVAGDGYFYFTDNTGIKRLNNRLGSGTYSNDTYDPTTNPSGKLTFIYSSTTVYKIQYLSNGYIYFVDGTAVKRFNLNDFTVETTNVVLNHPSSALRSTDFYAYINETAGLTVLYGYLSQADGVYLFADNSAQNYILFKGANLGAYDCVGQCNIQILSTDNYYYVAFAGVSGGVFFAWADYVLNKNGSVYITTPTAYRHGQAKGGSNVSLGMYSTHVMYADSQNNQYDIFNFIETGETITTTNPFELTYNAKQVNSLYDNYYNNSIFEIQYNVQISTSDIDTVRNFYNWRIELVSPDNIKIADFPITSNNLKCLDTVCLIPPNNYGFSGTLKFSPPSNKWDNGTYTVSLYEENITSSNKALLDDDSFNVFNQSGSLTGGVQPSAETQTSEQRMNTMLSSDYFWAFLIVAIGIAAGSVLGIIGGVLGGSAGIISSFLMGLLPLWGLLLFAIIVFLALGIYVKNQQGGV